MQQAGAKNKELQAGQDLLQTVRSGLILRGTTLHAWCKDHGINRANATTALLGGWRGPKGREVAAKVAAAAGVTVRWDR